jgi:hypothetical protein
MTGASNFEVFARSSNNDGVVKTHVPVIPELIQHPLVIEIPGFPPQPALECCYRGRE